MSKPTQPYAPPSVKIPTEQLPYPVLLHRIRFGMTPRPAACRSYGPVTLEEVALFGYGRKAPEFKRKPKADEAAPIEATWEHTIKEVR